MVKPGNNCIGFGLEIGLLSSHKRIFPDIMRLSKIFIHIARIDVHMDIDIVGKIVMDELCF